MAKLKVYEYPHPVLKQKAEKVAKVDDKIRSFLDDMLETMYDAAGVRRAAGKQAACLNKIIMDIYKQELKEAGGKLKELLGHTPMQVLVGAAFGVIYALYMHQFFYNLAQ